MGEVLAMDLGRLRALSGACDRAGVSAGDLADRSRRMLSAVGLPGSPALLMRELSDELAALGRFLLGAAERVEFADRMSTGLDGQGWFRTMRQGWIDAERDLWRSLRDDVGATALGVAPFTLDGSLIAIPRSQWSTAAIPPGCQSYGSDRYYSGGGAVRGPDGRLYPIVVPHYRVDGRDVTIDADLPPDVPSAASLGGSDPGWYVVGYRTGVEQVRRGAGILERILVGAAVATGLEFGPTIDDANLDRVVLRLGSRPFVASEVPTRAGVMSEPAELIPTVEPTAWLMVDGRAARYPVSTLDLHNRAVRRAAEQAGVDPLQPAWANRPADVLGLMIGAMQGAAVAMNLNDTTDRAYEVVFEENVDGRVRSRVQTFALEGGTSGAMLSAWHLFVDDAGRVMQSPVSYQVGPALTGRDAVQASNTLDPEFVTTLPETNLDAGS